MADGEVPIQRPSQRRGGLTTSSALYAILAGLAISAPLLGMMGFSFLASATLLIVTSPLLIIFSPLLFLAGAVVTLSLVGFAVAVGMAVAGMSAVGWTIKSLIRGRAGGGLSGDPMKGLVDQGREWAGYLQTKAGHHENPVNRG
uniref:Oleosin n=1 Tax=Kalanchoe fedtschenkoi TaxID=63787 RepID=A0A7N0TZV8_KALFE